MSTTVVVALVPMNPDALAAIVTVALPSVSVLSTVDMVNVPEVLPAAIVTVAGTVMREVVSDESVTVKAVVNVPEIDTVPVPVLPSFTVAGMDRLRFKFSLSATAMLPDVPSVQFVTCAVTVAFCVPSILPSSTTVIVKLADASPAGMIIVAGTVTAVTSLDIRETVTGLSTAALTVTVPVMLPTPSVVVAGADTVSVAVSLSFTENVAVPSK